MQQALQYLQEVWQQQPLALAGLLLGALAAGWLLLVWLRRWVGRASPIAELALTEEVGQYPAPPPLSPSDPRLKVHGIPMRIRLVVIAPLGRETQPLSAQDASTLLHAAHPHLAEAALRDQAKARVWPMQLSSQGFSAAVQRHTLFPPTSSRKSMWLLVSGKVIHEEQAYGLGLALWAERPHTLGPIHLDKPHRWMEILHWVD